MKASIELSIQHRLVYKEPGRFCGWPANHGIWSWGDEILVGFARVYYQANQQEHSIVKDKPSELRFARSLDGGETWALDGEWKWRLNDPGALTSFIGDSIPLPQAINFAHPDFVLKCFGSNFVISDDRGKSWQGPYALPDFGRKLTARTDYITEGADRCFVFLAAFEPAVHAKLKDRAFCIQTADGGKSFQFRGHMTGEPIAVRSVMPSTVRGAQGQFISALRRRLDVQSEAGTTTSTCWIDVSTLTTRGLPGSF
jgi:hypothetical protein